MPSSNAQSLALIEMLCDSADEIAEYGFRVQAPLSCTSKRIFHLSEDSPFDEVAASLNISKSEIASPNGRPT
jgi:hypothetical protein